MVSQFDRLLSHVLNVSRTELPRTSIAWGLKFLLHSTTVLAFTITLALFVGEMGIENLPYLFVFQAILTIIGTLGLAEFLRRFSKPKALIIGGLTTFVLSLWAFFIYPIDTIAFFGVMILIYSVVITQMNIALSLFIEELFTPLESERIFPIIESAEPIGGIFAGAITGLGIGVSFIEAHHFLLILSLLGIIFFPFTSFLMTRLNPIPKPHKKADEFERLKGISEIKESLNQIWKNPFLKALFISVIIQWLVYNLIEYQYTSALEHSVQIDNTPIASIEVSKDHTENINKKENNIIHEINNTTAIIDLHQEESINKDHLPVPIGIATNQTQSEINHNINHAENTHNTTSHDNSHSGSVADQLTHGLGLVYMAIHAIVLLFQLFLASKITKSLGIVRTILLHPLMVFISASSMLAGVTFNTATLSKASFEIFGGLGKNAYHSSFYVFRPHIRQRAKEFLEGVARPFGMLIGTGLIFLLQYITHGQDDMLALSITISILIFLGVRLLTAMNLGEKYTLLARKNLETIGHAPEKLDAIEILSQKGHQDPSIHLIKVLNFTNEKNQVHIKILSTLGEMKDVNAIPEIVKKFEHSDINVRIAAIQALSKFEDLGEHFMSQSFAKHRVIEALQNLFHSSQSKKIKTEVIRVFRNIKHPDIVPFLLSSLKDNDPLTIAGAIRVCGLFADISAGYYLEKFLTHEDPMVRSSAIIALWQFIPYRLQLTMTLAQMIESTDEKTMISGIYTIGETQSIQEIPHLKKLLEKHRDNHEIRQHVAVALAKMNHEHSIDHIVELLMHPKKEVARSTKVLFKSSHENIKKLVNQHLQQKITREILEILEKEESDILEEMSDKTLQELRYCYEILEEEKEMLEITEILDERKKAKIKKEEEKKVGTINENNGIKKMNLSDLL